MTKSQFTRDYGYQRTLGDLDGMAAAGVRMNNTRMERRGTQGDWFVQLHGHTILIRVAHADGTDILLVSMCGWPTPTTRDRLNRFLPDGISVYQRKNRQYLCYRATDESIVEMEIPPAATIRLESRDHGGSWTVTNA